jgi:hypothetical protein
LDAGALIEAKETRSGGNPAWVREQFAKHEIASEPGKHRTLVVALDAGAGVLDELAVLDAGGAGRFAGAAVEAFVDVVDEGRSDGEVASLEFARGLILRDAHHLVDAAAWGVGLEVPEAIGGAGAETEAAVHTASVIRVGGS